MLCSVLASFRASGRARSVIFAFLTDLWVGLIMLARQSCSKNTKGNVRAGRLVTDTSPISFSVEQHPQGSAAKAAILLAPSHSAKKDVAGGRW